LVTTWVTSKKLLIVTPECHWENICGLQLYSVAPPGLCNRAGEVRYGSIGGLEYEVSQSWWYCLCINVALCSTALQCICRVIRRSSVTMKAHTYYIIFGRPPRGGEASPFPPGGATGYTVFICYQSLRQNRAPYFHPALKMHTI